MENKFSRVLFLFAAMLLMFATSAYSAGNDSYTKLLIHSDTFDGVTDFEDSSQSGHDVYPIGNVEHSDAKAKFGNSSISFDGSGDRLSVPDSDDFFFNGDDFTIDFWVNFNTRDSQYLVAQHDDQDWSQNTWCLIFLSSNKLRFVTVINQAATHYDLSWTPTLNQWYHVAIVRHGTTLFHFIDGHQYASQQITQNIPNPSLDLTIGTDVDGRYGLSGYIDEFRISKGIARWIGDFNPPPVPYTLCVPDYNKDNVVNVQDLIDKQNDLLYELQDWTENCWKLGSNCQ